VCQDAVGYTGRRSTSVLEDASDQELHALHRDRCFQPRRVQYVTVCTPGTTDGGGVGEVFGVSVVTVAKPVLTAVHVNELLCGGARRSV